MRLTVDDVGYGGAGVARTGEGVVFIPGAFAGETVEAEIVARRKRFAQARLLEVLQPSPDRIAPAEPPVPGMVYAALRYEAEVALKQRQLQALLARIGRLDPGDALLPPVPSPRDLHYRNKTVLRWNGRILGYTAETKGTTASGRQKLALVPVRRCPLAVEAINEALARLADDRAALRRLVPGQRVTLRWTPHDGVRLGLGVPPEGWLTERVGGLTLRVAADAFFQVNLPAAERLLERFRERLGAPGRVFDLYCGCGLFGLAAAQAGATTLFGLETTPSAVAAARDNARAAGLDADYRCAPSESLPGDLPPADLWVVDPPREGLSETVRRHLLERRPPRLAYVSCGPDTLARDLAALAPAYRIDSLQLFDFFPRTAHFETLTFLSRRD